MVKNSITNEEIDEILENCEICTFKAFDKCTVVAVKLPNGFVLTASSACVDPSNYDEEIGKQICLNKIEDKLWELEGYSLQNELNKI